MSGKAVTVGILAFHGDVAEHERTLAEAARKLRKTIVVRSVRTREEIVGLDGLIIPGGESTHLSLMCEKEGMFAALKKVPAIFGTCAGAIMLAKKVRDVASGQKTLALMDIEVQRNAYGRQNESFEERMTTTLGSVQAVFIRAPRIMQVGKAVSILAKRGSDIVACEERTGGRYYLATTFHPELSDTVFHEHFLENVS